MIPTNYTAADTALAYRVACRLVECGRATIVKRVTITALGAPRAIQILYRKTPILTWFEDGSRILHSPAKFTAGHLKRLIMLCPDVKFIKSGYGAQITRIRIHYQNQQYILKTMTDSITLPANDGAAPVPPVIPEPVNVFENDMLRERLTWLPSRKHADAQLLMQFAQRHLSDIAADPYLYTQVIKCPYCYVKDAQGVSLGWHMGMEHLRVHMERSMDGPELLNAALIPYNSLFEAHQRMRIHEKRPESSLQKKWYPVFVLYLWKYGRLYGE